jgi:hypothetical protein
MDKIGDKTKTKAQLIEELQALRQQLAESQGREEKRRKRTEAALARESEPAGLAGQFTRLYLFQG